MKKPTKSLNLVGFIFIYIFAGREDGIRTHDAVAHIQTFQACSFNHSDTSLFLWMQRTTKFFTKKSRVLIYYDISPRNEVSKIVLKTAGATF